MQAQRVTLKLTDDEAFVLYDWLTRFHQRDMTDVADQAEQRVLFDLEARLEKILLALVQANYTMRVAQAWAVPPVPNAPATSMEAYHGYTGERGETDAHNH